MRALRRRGHNARMANHLLPATAFLALACAAAAPGARAQSVLAPGTPAVVTSAGFFIPDPASAVPQLFVPAAALGFPGGLAAPSVEWEGGDRFLIASGPALLRLTVLALAPPQYVVQSVTPASAAPLQLFDLDVLPGGGDLFLLDLAADVALRYAPPFAAGMLPVATLPIAPSARALAVDSRSQPNALMHVESQQVVREPLDGAAPAVVAEVPFAVGLDHDPRTAGKQGTFLVAKGSHTVGRTTNSPNLLIDLNSSGLCGPLALAPVDVEWSPLLNRAFVLAEDGVNPACSLPGAPVSGPNHVLRLPLAQGPVGPTLATFAGGSGITGTNGDLALVHGDFAFAAPYGSPCRPGGSGPVLDLAAPALLPGAGTATLTVHGAPALMPAWLAAGLAPLALPAFPSGCLLLAAPDVLFAAGATDAAGALDLALPVPPLPPGLDVYLQAFILRSGGFTVSEGLRLHLGS